ncbi:hypothetical protein B484DRAFT_389874 [Ochromonadaceae sp. CCMP2298]|nr:hypothetical protein B484DRAFT_389874 [Ochromonadaceae sp. CCMP2298]
MSQADRGAPSRASERCSILCAGENFTDFQVAACDEAAGMFGLGVEATAGTGAQATSSDRGRLYRELAEYTKQQGWMWLWLERSATKSFTTDVKVDARSTKILADRDPLQLYLLWKTISLERTSLNAELLHDRLKAAPTLASLFRQFNNLERNKKLGHKGKPTVDRRHSHEQEKVPARAFMATATPSPAQRGKPVSAGRVNKYASKTALSTGTYCTPTAPRGQRNPPPAGLVCHNCNKPKHKSKECTQPAATCGHCRNKWHMDMHCRKLRSEKALKTRDCRPKYTRPPSAHLASCQIPSYMSRTVDSDENSNGDFVDMEVSGPSAYPAEVNLAVFNESDTSDLDSSYGSTGSYTYESNVLDFDEDSTALSIFPRSWARSRRRTSAHARYANAFNSTADKYNLNSAYFIQ